MSSMRNAVQRRNHKERAQPREREKWGLLEKHKDYSLRARDYNDKKRKLKILRQKAAERNPDEFHFGMMSSKSDARGNRIADTRKEKTLSHEAAKLFKTQDAGYLRTMTQRTRREIERLEEGNAVSQKLGGKGQSKHIAFVESLEEQAEHGEVADEDVEGEEVEDLDTLRERRAQDRKRKRLREASEYRLQALKKREKELLAAEHELELQRARMTNSIGGVSKNGVKLQRRERKR